MMSDITYHEKSQSDPNAKASEDTVIDVLRRSVDKRVSLLHYLRLPVSRPQNVDSDFIQFAPLTTQDTSIGIIPLRPSQPGNPLQGNLLHLLLPPPHARALGDHTDLEWDRLRFERRGESFKGRDGQGVGDFLAGGQ